MSEFMFRHVSPETSTKSRHASRPKPRISLREDRFNAATAAAGYKTDVARAELLEVSERTINRARHGVIGQDFIAKTLTALNKHAEKLASCNIAPTFESLFEVSNGCR